MTWRERVPLAPYTSFKLGGPAHFFIEAHSVEEIQEAARFAREHALPLRPLGLGTNVLIPDEGVEAVVVRLTGTDFSFTPGELTADAGTSWDALVTAACERGLWGIENLAGIPGTAGGALVQNIGAYGAELASTFLYADAFDLTTLRERRIERAEAELGYRTSLFKRRPDLVITRITLALTSTASPVLSYPDLARAQAAGVPLATPRDIAAAVRAIRAGKFPQGGRSAGSFFKNPTVEKGVATALQARYPGLPAYPLPDGAVKLSLAWLLDHALGLAGYTKGPVRLYEKQPLVVVASEGARATDIDALAYEVAERVQGTLGITLEREVESFC